MIVIINSLISATAVRMAGNSIRSYDISELENAIIHGCIVKLLPVKSDENKQHFSYFNGNMSDNVKMSCFVSSEPKLENL